MMNIRDLLIKYPCVFPYQTANEIQVDSFHDVFNSNKSVVIKAPTGSGKTVIFEIAVLRCLIDSANNDNFKILYVAPLKSLCHERFISWQEKFKDFSIKGIEITGENEISIEITDYNIIYTTPEKLDCITRRNDSFGMPFNQIKVVCIDEIHTLNDQTRGVTLEVVITRLKQIVEIGTRFVVASATIGNISDFVEWFATDENPCVAHEMADRDRTVKLTTQVLAYPRPIGQSLFQFDNILNHRIPDLICGFSDGKPVLIFCMTRKSTVQIASFLVEQTTFELDADQLQQLCTISQKISDFKLRACLIRGVGFHHAGLSTEDRQIIENSYLSGALPVLSCTSTLAMGVNLPAHLVIVKGTYNYNFGSEHSYTQNTLLQMIGRAGRPQFDDSAVAIVMTSTDDEAEIKRILHMSCEAIESHLHTQLTEHLNAEVAIRAVSKIQDIEHWIRATFFYVRSFKNPNYYGLPHNSFSEMIPKSITKMILDEIDQLARNNLITYDHKTGNIESTACGQLAAKYFIGLKTIGDIQSLGTCETIESLITFVSQCAELKELNLRYNERTNMNNLNKHKGPCKLRFPIKGRITNASLKISCLIQATLGCQEIKDSSLLQETDKIFRIGTRILRCIHDYWFQLSCDSDYYKTLLNCTILKKCFTVKLWEDSWLVSQQIPAIGSLLACHIADTGLNTLNKLANAPPKLIESILHRHPPFGRNVVEYASGFPKYELTVEQINEIESLKCSLEITVKRMRQRSDSDFDDCHSRFSNDSMIILIGDESNHVCLKSRILNYQVAKGTIWKKTLDVVKSSAGPFINIDLVSESYVGFDIRTRFQPVYSDQISTSSSKSIVKQNRIVETNKRKVTNNGLEIKCGTQLLAEMSTQFTTPAIKKPKIFSWKTCNLNKNQSQDLNFQSESKSVNLNSNRFSNNAHSDDFISYQDVKSKNMPCKTRLSYGFEHEINLKSQSMISDCFSDDSFDEEMSQLELPAVIINHDTIEPTTSEVASQNSSVVQSVSPKNNASNKAALLEKYDLYAPNDSSHGNFNEEMNEISPPILDNIQVTIQNQSSVKMNQFSSTLPHPRTAVSSTNLVCNEELCCDNIVNINRFTTGTYGTVITPTLSNQCELEVSNNIDDSFDEQMSKMELELFDDHDGATSAVSKTNHSTISPINESLIHRISHPDLDCDIDNTVRVAFEPMSGKTNHLMNDNYSSEVASKLAKQSIYNQGWEDLFDFIKQRSIIMESRANHVTAQRQEE